MTSPTDETRPHLLSFEQVKELAVEMIGASLAGAAGVAIVSIPAAAIAIFVIYGLLLALLVLFNFIRRARWERRRKIHERNTN